MTPVFCLCLAICLIMGLFVVLLLERKVKEAKNTRHVISLPFGTRFVMDDSDSVWVLVHLDGCGQVVEWRGNDCSARIQKQRYIVGDEKHLRHVVVKVVQ